MGPRVPNNTFAGDPHFLDCPETLVAILENVVFLVVSILTTGVCNHSFTGWTTLKGLAVPITASGLQDE